MRRDATGRYEITSTANSWAPPWLVNLHCWYWLIRPAGGASRHRHSPQRITAKLPWALHCQLRDRADIEGRSLSNLVAHLLEAGIKSTGLPGKI